MTALGAVKQHFDFEAPLQGADATTSVANVASHPQGPPEAVGTGREVAGVNRAEKVLVRNKKPFTVHIWAAPLGWHFATPRRERRLFHPPRLWVQEMALFGYCARRSILR